MQKRTQQKKAATFTVVKSKNVEENWKTQTQVNGQLDKVRQEESVWGGTQRKKKKVKTL